MQEEEGGDVRDGRGGEGLDVGVQQARGAGEEAGEAR